jgi:hypothetical protein
MHKLSTTQVTAQVFDDGMLGVKMRTDLRPGTYEGVLVLQRQEVRTADPTKSPDTFVPLAEYVLRCLDACNGNRTQTANLLGVDVRTIFRLLADG